METKKLHVVLVSMGRTSAFLAKYFKEKHGLKPMAHYLTKGKPAFYSYYNDTGMKVIFLTMNTGRERKESFIFLRKLEMEFGIKTAKLEAVVNSVKGFPTSFNIVGWQSINFTGKPFEAMLKKYPMPHNRGVSNCTRELKQRPKEQFLKRFFPQYDYIDVVGIRADESHRKSINAGGKAIYPLCDEFPVNSEFIRSWWSRQSFDLQLKDYEGNCDLCFKKSLKKRLTIIKENPNVAIWWQEMEDKYADFYDSDESVFDEEEFINEFGYLEIQYVLKEKVIVTRRRNFDMRTHKSIAELVEMAKLPFTEAKDLHELSQQQKDLFEFETDCFCKAT